MVLYEAVSTYHLLCAITDQAKNQHQNCILLMSLPLSRKYPDFSFLAPYFSRVLVYDINIAIHLRMNVNAIQRYFCDLLDISDLEKPPFEKIYCSCGHHSFGYFLSVSNIPYVFCEDSPGILSRAETLVNLNDKVEMRSSFNEHCIEMGLYDGSNPNIIVKRCNFSAQTEDFVAEKAEHFDVLQELACLDSNVRNQIISSFVNASIHLDVKNYCRKKSVLLLTQHFTNLEMLHFEQQALIYQMVVDYFFADAKLIIKPHPDDFMYYSQLFPAAQLIRDRFPSELMPYVFDNQPDCVATISSTATYSLRGHYPNIFELDSLYEKDFEMTHRYYTAVKIAQKLGLSIVCLDANEVLVQRLCETLEGKAPAVSCDLSDTDKRCLLLVDDVTAQGEDGRALVRDTLDRLHPDACALFINSKQDFCWYDYDRRDMWKNTVPVVLTKTALEARSEDFYASLEDEVIYIYSQNEELLTMAKDTQIKKELSHTGVQLSTIPLTAEQERIKTLEGILAATERRLLYYIEKEREQK